LENLAAMIARFFKTIGRFLWRNRWRISRYIPAPEDADRELGTLRKQLDQLQEDRGSLERSVDTLSRQIRALKKKAVPGVDIGDGKSLIRLGVVFAWLTIATASSGTLLISVFLGREIPDFAIVKDAIGLVGIAAAPIVVWAINEQRKKGNGGE
jgi:hypothetical protein